MNPTLPVTIEFDVEARMRDGVILRANVFRPNAPGTFPVVLSRTPYNKISPSDGGFDPLLLSRSGFIVAVQDVRGRYASDGEWEAFEHEREDGYDSVEWAARLPGSNGRVGMYGASYIGTTQWAAAVTRPPSLKAIMPALTWRDMADGVIRRDGAIDLGLPAFWTLFQGFDYLARTSTPQTHQERYDLLADTYDALATDGYWTLPAIEMPYAKLNGLPTASMHPDNVVATSYTDADFDGLDADLGVAATAGWYDLFIQGSLDTYMAARERGLDARLTVGPWTHTSLADRIGQRSFGIRSARDTFMADYTDSWFARHLGFLTEYLGDGAAAGDQPDNRVRIFVMGRNEWRDEPEWPLARAVDQRWHLRSDGGLDPDASASPDTETREYDYDPADPVPTTGGAAMLMPGFHGGPMDQAPIEGRDDVLVYTSAPLAADLEVTGRLRAAITVQSSAGATDWVVRLCDVDPEGRSWVICDGITRILDGADQVRLVEIDLWSTSNVFLAGHRLRVHVTSSCFPRWDRNLNTGDQNADGMVVAHQRVHHGAATPSWVELPVIAD
ncbi:CocE/NonD family hydrolase [Nocardia sp. NPDC058176]|uniref:CocE/NonD family hydrolase n=1 Tax=Nocardia sp. NPDC058176 TaxID=3346368 RepID=UPI0036DC5666